MIFPMDQRAFDQHKCTNIAAWQQAVHRCQGRSNAIPDRTLDHSDARMPLANRCNTKNMFLALGGGVGIAPCAALLLLLLLLLQLLPLLLLRLRLLQSEFPPLPSFGGVIACEGHLHVLAPLMVFVRMACHRHHQTAKTYAVDALKVVIIR